MAASLPSTLATPRELPQHPGPRGLPLASGLPCPEAAGR